MKSLNFPYSPALDQIRMLAASLVFAFHFYLHYYKLSGAVLGSSWWGLVSEGHTGVALFFTLSGFLFMRIAYHQAVIEYRQFVRNRILRIFPLYLVMFFLATSIGRNAFQPQDIFYLLFSNLGNAPTSGSVITGAAWTISVELTFYLLFPFLSRMVINKGLRYIVQLLALMLLFKLSAYSVTPASTHMLFSTLVGRFDQFVIGMLAALVWQHQHAGLRRWSKYLFPCALLAVIVNSALQAHFAPFGRGPVKHPFWITWSMQEALGWAAFIVTWAAAEYRLPAWLSRLLAQGGEISFSFYMLHFSLIFLLVTYCGFIHITGINWLDSAVVFVVLYAFVWAVARLSFVTIEQPFLRMRRPYGETPAP